MAHPGRSRGPGSPNSAFPQILSPASPPTPPGTSPSHTARRCYSGVTRYPGGGGLAAAERARREQVRLAADRGLTGRRLRTYQLTTSGTRFANPTFWMQTTGALLLVVQRRSAKPQGRIDGRGFVGSRMVRPGSWSRPAGGSPVRVIAGEPGSRPRFVVERRRAGRGVKSLCGGSRHAGRSITRILQPRQSYSGGAEPLMSRRRQHLAGWRSGDAPAGSLRGKGSGTRAWSGPEQERPVCPARVGRRLLV